MLKAELFNIEDKKKDQRRAIMELTGEQRIYLTLDLMDLARQLSPTKSLPSKEDNIKWIELKYRDAK
jgi:hypothetical protein